MFRLAFVLLGVKCNGVIVAETRLQGFCGRAKAAGLYRDSTVQSAGRDRDNPKFCTTTRSAFQIWGCHGGGRRPPPRQPPASTATAAGLRRGAVISL
jgi:hypothetical protein